MNKIRNFFAGVGGQGTLTATNLLALMALDKDIPVTSGEIHGMAQRGGIVESTVLIGGYLSPKISRGEADILLGFEPLETLRALPYLKNDGLIISNTEPTYPVAVSLGKEKYPDIEYIKEKCQECSPNTYFLPCLELGKQAGTVLSGNIVLLGGYCALEATPFSLEDLHRGIQNNLPKKIADVNIKAGQLGYDYLLN